MRGDYIAIFSYFGIMSTIYIGAVLWMKFRKAVARRLHVEEYRDPRVKNHPA